jgi:trehalose 6-phosphate phosphatase
VIDREAVLTSAVERAPDIGFFFDFDGVLAPIADDPEQVYPVAGLVEALAELGRYATRLAIVSARPVDFLRHRFADLTDVTLYGLYGLEAILPDQRRRVDPVAQAAQPLIAELVRRARVELPPETLIEDKRLSLALHYRTAPHLQDVVDRWGTERAAELGLRAQRGRMVTELKPPGSSDKGTVLAREIADLSSAWYYGDDLGDLRAFEALDAREASDRAQFQGVRVAVANPETGAALTERADLVVESPYSLLALLRDLNARLAGTGPSRA